MSLSVQFLSLLAMIGTGIVTGAFMDLIGTVTSYASKKSFVRRRAAWFEIIGWVIAGCGAFYVLFHVRDGAWRMYDPLAQVSGLLLYASFFHKPFRLLGRIIVILLIRPIVFIIGLIMTMIRLFFRFIFSIIAFLLMPFVKLYRFISRKISTFIRPRASAFVKGKKKKKGSHNSDEKNKSAE